MNEKFVQLKKSCILQIKRIPFDCDLFNSKDTMPTMRESEIKAVLQWEVGNLWEGWDGKGWDGKGNGKGI